MGLAGHRPNGRMPTMRLAIMLFTRDLRLQDNPALDAAARRAQAVVPLFVLDDRLVPLAGPNRMRFLLESLTDLRAALRERGGDLIIRRGDPVTEVIGLARDTGADGVFCADDVSCYAAARRRRLTAACQAARLGLTLCPGVTVVPPGELRPSGGGDHYRVFTAYLRAWERAERRPVAATPDQVRLAAGLTAGDLPDLGAPGPGTFPGGETAGNKRLDAWLRSGGPGGYADGRNDLAGDLTSRLSPYLHFGCLSPLRLAQAAGPGEFTRQLAWRDFFHQVTAAFPAITTRDYRPGRGGQGARDSRVRWRDDDEALEAWRQGRTGVPIVDAGMRQLLREGWMHNRARMITASFLCKQLHIDWRLGARHFMALLADGDIASNYGNWQWAAGTGNDTRPGRVLSPLRQATRFDPDGDYVRRYVPELAGLDAAAIRRPWTLPAGQRRGYPAPIIET
jgi:deoxyribodipyrimidine photo-lyase